MSFEYITLLILFCIVGSVVGSFLNLAIHRIPLKQDIVYKNSYCPNCQHKLQFVDLIPILSYIFLRGKCRHCGIEIKPRYLYIELLILALYGITFIINGLAIKTLFILAFYTITVLIIGMIIEKSYISKGTLNILLLINLIYIIYKFLYKYDIMLVNSLISVTMLVISVYYMINFQKGRNNSRLVYLSTIITVFNIYSLPYNVALVVLSYLTTILVNKQNKIKINNTAMFCIITLVLSLVYNFCLRN